MPAGWTRCARSFSEYGLIRRRLQIELEWLKALAAEPHFREIPAFPLTRVAILDSLLADFGPSQAAEVKEIEAITNRDVKALEYWIKQRLANNDEVMRVSEFIHFACTSEDINNLAHALMLRAASNEILLPTLDKVAKLRDLAHGTADHPMMSRTHGQPATPTTLGKKMANFAHRLVRARAAITRVRFARARSTGRWANRNAHLVAYPDFDWRNFVGLCRIAGPGVQSLHHARSSRTTRWRNCSTRLRAQFDPDRSEPRRLGLFRWAFPAESQGWRDRLVDDAAQGQSDRFRNSEGNLGLANALLRHLADKLPVSRWQRDLTDSTVLRNMGVALGQSAGLRFVVAWPQQT